MTSVWITIAVLSLGTFAAKLVGPLTVGDRVPDGRGLEVTRLVAPAILAGLVVYETFTAAEGGFTVDARVAGLAAAAAGLMARLPMIVVVLLAAAATALTRALI
jgi:predicted anti-sigma-YlaC factor YlaD